VKTKLPNCSSHFSNESGAADRVKHMKMTYTSWTFQSPSLVSVQH